MEATIKDGKLCIEIPIGELRPSSTGKTLIVATTGGAMRTSAQCKGKPVTVNLSAWISREGN